MIYCDIVLVCHLKQRGTLRELKDEAELQAGQGHMKALVMNLYSGGK